MTLVAVCLVSCHLSTHASI